MKKVIITGFEPFGNYKHNPTQELAESYDTLHSGHVHAIGLVLPCTYYGGFQILSRTIDKEKPDAIISTGLSSSVGSIRIETLFRNKMKSKYADGDGYKPNGIRINARKNAEENFITNADVGTLVKILKNENIQTETSVDANTFICNSLAYLTMQKIVTEGLHTRFMFLHTPWTDDYQGQIELDPGKVFINKVILYRAMNLLIENI